MLPEKSIQRALAVVQNIEFILKQLWISCLRLFRVTETCQVCHVTLTVHYSSDELQLLVYIVKKVLVSHRETNDSISLSKVVGFFIKSFFFFITVAFSTGPLYSDWIMTTIYSVWMKIHWSLFPLTSDNFPSTLFESNSRSSLYYIRT